MKQMRLSPLPFADERRNFFEIESVHSVSRLSLCVASLLVAPCYYAAMAQTARAPEPAYSWTGPYIGLNGGMTGGSFAYRPIEMEALKPNEPEKLTLNRNRNSAAGGFFGAQIGYLYQFQNNVVVGAETDFQIGPYLTSGTEHEISSEANTRES